MKKEMDKSILSLYSSNVQFETETKKEKKPQQIKCFAII